MQCDVAIEIQKDFQIDCGSKFYDVLINGISNDRGRSFVKNTGVV